MRKYAGLPLVVGPLQANHVSGRLVLISAITAFAASSLRMPTHSCASIFALKTREEHVALLPQRERLLDLHQTLHVWLPSGCAFPRNHQSFQIGFYTRLQNKIRSG